MILWIELYSKSHLRKMFDQLPTDCIQEICGWLPDTTFGMLTISTKKSTTYKLLKPIRTPVSIIRTSRSKGNENDYNFRTALVTSWQEIMNGDCYDRVIPIPPGGSRMNSSTLLKLFTDKVKGKIEFRQLGSGAKYKDIRECSVYHITNRTMFKFACNKCCKITAVQFIHLDIRFVCLNCKYK